MLISESEPTAAKLRGLLPRAANDTRGDEAFEIADEQAKLFRRDDCHRVWFIPVFRHCVRSGLTILNRPAPYYEPLLMAVERFFNSLVESSHASR